jgi:hypothetical protein
LSRKCSTRTKLIQVEKRHCGGFFPEFSCTSVSYDDLDRKGRIPVLTCTYLLVAGEGFEPSKAEPGDLQSPPIGRSGNPPGSFFEQPADITALMKVRKSE